MKTNHSSKVTFLLSLFFAFHTYAFACMIIHHIDNAKQLRTSQSLPGPQKPDIAILFSVLGRTMSPIGMKLHCVLIAEMKVRPPFNFGDAS